ncbi:MAG: hypothetical protein ABGW84_11350 [Sphingomonadaceae bacterium]
MNLTFDDYLAWHAENLGEDLNSAELASIYNVNARNLLGVVSTGDFLKDFEEGLRVLEDAGDLADGQSNKIKFQAKSLSSVINKIYRLNCHWNRKWPHEPRAGWVKLKTCFSQMDDIVRATVVSKLLDGVQSVVDAAVLIGEEREDVCIKASPRATESGHYAWHIYVTTREDVLIDGAAQEIDFRTEVQVITQLQSVLKGLTHPFYERSRVNEQRPTAERRWQFDEPGFRGEFLGHTLHLVDAMILELKKEAEDAAALEAHQAEEDN